MEAYIKYIGDYTDNYNRFGKVIPKEEKKIEIKNFFNCNAEKEKFIISKLLNDKKVKFNLIKSAGSTREYVEKIERSKRGKLL